ncbi:MAG TPA: DUF5343 domain-containing protein [Dehalococcoidia bacterium]|nr:DUF5343 domain-containing protein [Dehalococcoidia bacterium]
MAARERELDGRGMIPPYGPTRGTLQSLQLLRRTTPARIDSDFLRVNKVAPGNEYKVVGALRFLNLIDDDGRPTENSRLLKTKGATYTLALQDIVRNAYSGVFQQLKPTELTRDGIYNYFVTDGGLGAEMATKATRFLIKLCRLAEIEIALDTTQPAPRGRRKTRSPRHAYRQVQAESVSHDESQLGLPTLPFVLALTPETAEMDVDQLAELFRKVKTALERSLTD